MPYQTVFQINFTKLEWGPSALAFALAVIMFLYARSMKDESLSRRRFFTYCSSIATFFFGMLFTLVVGHDFLNAYRDFRHGNVQVVQGSVEDFHPMPTGGGGIESFRVQGVKFEYSNFISNPGFNETSSYGGPIREGLPVRVTFVPDLDSSPHRNIIVKLEIEKSSIK